MSERRSWNCYHDSVLLTVTGRELTDGNLTWVMVTCECGKVMDVGQPLRRLEKTEDPRGEDKP